jgi:histone-lysine N-methyltransferase SETD3
MEYAVEVPMPRDDHVGLRDKILREIDLSTTIPLSSPDAPLRLLVAARVASLDNREAYFAPASGWAAKVAAAPVAGARDAIAVSPRNETAACALVLELLTAAGAAAAGVLPHARTMCDAALAAPTPPAHQGGDNAAAAAAAASPPDDGGVGDAMVAWVRSGSDDNNNGTTAVPRIAIAPARFQATGRGAAAAADIPAGEDAVCVPQHMLWTVAVAMEAPGPRGDAYRMFAVLGEDCVAALWLVAEHAMGAASPWAPLLASLPLGGGGGSSGGGVGGGSGSVSGGGGSIGGGSGVGGGSCGGMTPVSWPREATQALLGGTPLLGDACAAQDKLGRQYHALFPALSENMPEVFPAALYTPENFRAATEAWNSYGMTVQAEAGGSGAAAGAGVGAGAGAEPAPAPVTCLPPVALLCNHTLWPHAVRYSRLRGGALHLPVARSVKSGEEVFVSYGAKSNAELLLFYGFALENNPYDDVPLSLELPGGEVGEVTAAREAALLRAGLSLTPHAVRAGALPLPLVGTLRVLTADVAALATFTGDPRVQAITSEGEAAAAAALCGALGALLEQLAAGEEDARRAAALLADAVGAGAVRAVGTYRAGVRLALETAMGEARRWRAAVGGGPDPALGKRSRD